MDSARGGGPTIVLDESTLLVLRDKNLLIEHDWLSMGEILGRGLYWRILYHQFDAKHILHIK